MLRRLSNRSSRVLGATLAAALVFAGCTHTPPTRYVPITGDALVDGKAHLEAALPKDRVLWEYRVAATAMRRGIFDEARAQLDDALSQAAANYGNISAQAAKSRRMFRRESDKPFIGEPYERALAHFYRAILYWQDGEPDNARALLRTAQLLDSDTADKTYAGDYVLFDYLEGFVTSRLGGNGSDALARARANARAQGRAVPPDYDTAANVLVFAEFGRGPQKYSDGQYNERLKFTTTPSAAQSAVLEVAGRRVSLPAYDDLNFQATTRGGRVMDHILGNKAVFKGTAEGVGDVALVGATVAADNIYRYDGTYNRDAANVAIALAAVGIISKLTASATTPEADTRTWDNIPQYLSFAALRLEPGEYPATITFLDASGRPVANGRRDFTLTVAAQSESIGGRRQDTVVFLSQLFN